MNIQRQPSERLDAILALKALPDLVKTYAILRFVEEFSDDEIRLALNADQYTLDRCNEYLAEFARTYKKELHHAPND